MPHSSGSDSSGPDSSRADSSRADSSRPGFSRADFSRRSSLTERMDDPSTPPVEVARALDELEAINRLLGGHATSLAGIGALLGRRVGVQGEREAGPRTGLGAERGAGLRVSEFTLLDVGAGGGDLARRVASWAERRGIRARVLGIDLLPAAVERARLRSDGCGCLRFETADLFDLPPEETYDVVHAAMMLHHLDDAKAAEALGRMHALARRGVVINDIHRHPLAYHSIRILTRIFSRSPLVRSDAPISVLRAFRRGELAGIVARAGLPPASIRWRWAFRWEVVVPKGILEA